MEKQFVELLSLDTKYQIIGEHQQVLQILLMPEESIKTKESMIQYFTNNIDQQPINKKNHIYRFLVPSDEPVRAINKSKTVGCVGLARNTGKILVLDFNVLMSFWVKESYVLAMTSRLEYQNRGRYLFFLTLDSFPAFGFGAFKRIVMNHDQFKTQLVFLQSQGTLMEKELGVGETFCVKQDLIAAFSDKVKLTFNLKHMKYLTLTGPGRVYYEGMDQTFRMSPVMQHQLRRSALLAVLVFIMFVWGLIVDNMFVEID